MQPNLPLLDRTVMSSVEEAEQKIEELLKCDVIYYLGDIRESVINYFRSTVEHVSAHSEVNSQPKALSICLTTWGGEAEAVEKMVEIVRHHYKKVYFIVPRFAMSAGTIFCMSGNKIYMDYSSSLGPIDPQVLDREGRNMVPALGYLDKAQELIEKSQRGILSPAEFAQLERLDLAMLRHYEQARELSEALLKEWLIKYKFSDWKKHRTTEPGTPVTKKDKEKRASEIAAMLSDNQIWLSHGRMIGMKKLITKLRLEIDNLEDNENLLACVRTYNDTLTDYLDLHGKNFVIYNRKAI